MVGFFLTVRPTVFTYMMTNYNVTTRNLEILVKTYIYTTYVSTWLYFLNIRIQLYLT
jgi:hypothetical protein